MHSKFEKFNELLKELKIETAKNLSIREIVHLAHTSKYHLALFKPVIDVRKLVHHVTHGEHDEVIAMLKQDMNLIFKRGTITDCSGREFKNISGFEYALWALDKHMWAAMIACIPSTEEGKKVFAQLIAQYNKVNTIGVTYKLNGKTITEKHFDFKNTIIKELKTQVYSIEAPGVKNWAPIINQWVKGVGGAQKLLPMHVVDEYCSHLPFYPGREFTSQPNSSKQFHNRTTGKDENWFSIDSKLSVDFAIYKREGWAAGPVGDRNVWGYVPCLRHDLDAVTALCKVRANDFIDLKSILQNQMTPDKQHQVSHILSN